MSFRRLWLYWLPLLFLPNLGFASSTGFGTLQISDYLILPYIFLVLLGMKGDPYKRLYKKLVPWLAGFVIVAIISTLTIELRYPDASSYATKFGLLKIGKLVLYGVAGLLTVRALGWQKNRELYDWMLLVSALVVTFSLWFFTAEGLSQLQQGPEMYRATNAISVLAAILLVYLGGRYLTNSNTPQWRKWVIRLLPLLVIGFLLSQGRGGWVAALAGALYLFYRYGVNRKIVLAVVIIVACFAIAYTQYSIFQKEVDKTFWPEQQQRRYYAGVGGINEGQRIEIWINSLSQFTNAPLFGTGFFHRGGSSGIYAAGSHNFFIQMLLETGLLGFIILCFVLYKTYRQVHRSRFVVSKLYLPVTAALVTAFVGGMSGEYFYGGMVLFTFFAVYAPVGSVPLNYT